MAGGGKGNMERVRRGFRTVFFMLTMVASLLLLSAPVAVAVGDVSVSLALASKFACARCYGLREHLRRYGFRSSLMDIPVVSILRSLIITCIYFLSDEPGLSHGPYVGSTTLCSFSSIVILLVKACVFTPVLEEMGSDEALTSLPRARLNSMVSWGVPFLFLSSLVFALFHVVVAYRTSCKARRKLLFHCVDPESVLLCKNSFSGYPKVPRSPSCCNGKHSKSDSETKRKASFRDERDLPISFLADIDSLFIACQGITVHYKLCLPESPLPLSIPFSPFLELSPNSRPPSMPSGSFRLERPLPVPSKIHFHRTFSNQFQISSLYTPLLADSSAPSPFLSDQVPALILDDEEGGGCLPGSMNLDMDLEDKDRFAVILIHGFGGGVFSWRHVMDVLARQIGCTVVAFDRPGWGLTSRPRRKDWEGKQLPNPYKLESQVDLLISFCLEMGFSSVVLVGHDDGGLLVLKAAEKIRSSMDVHVEVKGVVLISASLSREVIPAFARILLHTSLRKKHMVRPLLQTEITQVINRRAWYDATKLTAEVMNLYKASLLVEGWDEALHEIGRLSFSTVLSPENGASLLRSVEDLPVLIVAGAEDALVSLKSAQAMSSKLVNSRLVAISGCGHLPHEECPKALLAALSPFITRVRSYSDCFQRQ
ncbi:Prolyl aminopeptidase protein [Dioscorea alata]|uniref:Prolyl aminopeptidase protein n=1 Tax=Dioscorea alata TaxID=55571 RepID=A0ACB7WFK0_DIOAL|nr:Prolyl aminopeptidase protein [Dioscorea alata]